MPAADGASKTRRGAPRASGSGTAKPKLKLAEKGESRRGSELARLQAERELMQRELADARARIALLERLADEDSLAPIANRRAFVRELSRMIAFTRRYGPPSSVIYFDVNGMKQINDTHGHPAGDAALRHVADILAKNVRESDIVGRLGGDEFGVILAQTSQEQANAKAVALAQEISSTALRWGKFDINVTAAYGVYSFTGTDDAQVAIEAADKAMYRQKRVRQPV
ncbi:MAG TPA: GGDEF domain-containing protein [Stellaceae bacterium]|nr:GGDEF domain-containing protein [Stellaceae bacterium]